MSMSRREFIRNVGVAAASAVLLRCSTFSSQDSSPRGKLRSAWLKLDWLAKQSTGNSERGEKARDELAAQHRAALDELVAAGELTPAVAEELQAAYDAATYHVYRSNAPITCYEPVIVDYTPSSSNELTKQADMLAEMAESGDLDPATVSQAQEAIARDISFVSLTQDERQALYDLLIQAADQGAPIPPFDQIDVDITPEATEAAHFLVEVLLEE